MRIAYIGQENECSNIVYAGSDETIEITLEQFLEENPGMTEEDFNFWKNWSDEDYYITDRKDTNEAIDKFQFVKQFDN